MNQPTITITAPTTTQTPATQTTTAPTQTRAERAAAIKAEADAPSTTTAPSTTAPTEGTTTSTPTATETGAPDPKAKAAADRVARIRAMQDREREKQQKRKAHQASRAEQEELAQLRQMKAEWEKNSAAFKDEEAFLAACEAKGITAEKVITFFRDKMTNPEAIAERKANATKSEVQKELEEIRRQLKERDERDAQERQQTEFQQKSLAAAKSFVELTRTKAEDAPLTAALYEKHGADVVIGYVNNFILPLMPEGFDMTNPEHLEVLHDHTEQLLSEMQLSSSTPAKTTPDTSSKANAGKKNGEESPVTTLSNRIVSERGTVTESVPLAKMSFEERKRFLKEKYEREDA